MANPSLGATSLPAVVSWVQAGDLHLSESVEKNHRDLQTLVNEASANLGDVVAFVVLPGHNVNDGTEAQFRLSSAGTGKRIQEVEPDPIGRCERSTRPKRILIAASGGLDNSARPASHALGALLRRGRSAGDVRPQAVGAIRPAVA